MVTRRKFSREFKLEAVKLVTERGGTVAQAGKDLDVHENVLRKCIRASFAATEPTAHAVCGMTCWSKARHAVCTASSD